MKTRSKARLLVTLPALLIAMGVVGNGCSQDNGAAATYKALYYQALASASALATNTAGYVSTVYSVSTVVSTTSAVSTAVTTIN